MRKKRRNLEEIYYPVPENFTIEGTCKLVPNNTVIKQIIKWAVKGAYKLKNLREYDYQGYAIKPKAVASQEQMDMVIHLIESLQPADAIEAALASQFAITYIRGLEESSKEMVEELCENFINRNQDLYSEETDLPDLLDKSEGKDRCI